jgi:hypothetical protein
MDSDYEAALREKDAEIEVYKSGMDEALMELEELKLVCVVVIKYSALADLYRTKEMPT